MNRTKLLAGILLGTALLGTSVGLVMAEAPSHSAALTGKVSSQAEGPMEGVLVGAKKVGSTITTWVVSDAQGRYSFPSDRMDEGKYAISIRAVGYELPRTSVDVTEQPAQLDLQLNKVTTEQARHAAHQRRVAHQRPGNAEEKARRLRHLPHAAENHVLALRYGRDGDGRAAHGHAHEQLFAHASLGAPEGRSGADAADDRQGEIYHLGQPERAGHLLVPVEDAAAAHGQGHASDLHHVRLAAD